MKPAHIEPSRMAQFRMALNTPVDIAWLAAFRFLFGAIMCFSMVRFLLYGWIDRFFVEPTFHFKYWGFAWVPAPSAFMAHALFFILTALSVAVALGAWFRITAPLFAILFSYVQLIDVATYLNHYYLAALLSWLLAASPAHKYWSIDALRKGHSVALIRRAWLWLFRMQIGVVYTFAGMAKAQADWLVEAQPLRIWLSSLTDLPVLGAVFASDLAAPLMSWGGFLFDSTIVLWMSWRRTRLGAYLVIIGFHACTRVLFPIGMFPVIMTVSALVFFAPGWPRLILTRWRLLDIGLASSPPQCTPKWNRTAIAVAMLFAFVQLGVPLRHLAYGGNVLWDEQGMRFSWRVMVREKNGSVTYLVKREGTNREWEVSSRKYLTAAQEGELVGQPDLILQLAHHIQHDLTERGLGRLEVRAEASVSLNGRPAAHLVDPTVDLARVTDGIGAAPWILPLPTQPIPSIRALQ